MRPITDKYLATVPRSASNRSPSGIPVQAGTPPQATALRATTADLPYGPAGSISIGPNVNATEILFDTSSQRVEWLQRMACPVGPNVSTGFVVRADERLSQHLTVTGSTRRAGGAGSRTGARRQGNVINPDLDADTGASKPGVPDLLALAAVVIPAGCRHAHYRPAPRGAASAIWPLNCGPCERELDGGPLWGRMPPRDYQASTRGVA